MLILFLFRSFFYLCKWRDWLWGRGEMQGVNKQPQQVCNSCPVKHRSMHQSWKSSFIILSLLAIRDVQKDQGRPRVPVVCLERLKILVSQLPPHGRRQSDPLPASGTQRSDALPQQRARHDAAPEVCLISIYTVEERGSSKHTRGIVKSHIAEIL